MRFDGGPPRPVRKGIRFPFIYHRKQSDPAFADRYCRICGRAITATERCRGVLCAECATADCCAGCGERVQYPRRLRPGELCVPCEIARLYPEPAA
jgi:hypothetical protein